MEKFVSFLHSAWSDLLSWFGVEEQKLASFLYPVFQDAKKLVQKDVLKDIIAGAPVVAAAVGGGPAAMLAAAEGVVIPLLTQQGIELASTTVATLSNALVAQANAGLQTIPAADASPAA